MSKILITALLLAFSSQLPAYSKDGNSPDEFIKRSGRGKGRTFDRLALIRAIDETLVMVEDLSRRLKLASKEEIEEVWASGERDFKLESSEVRYGRKACESTQRALEHEGKGTELDADKAKAYRNDARDQIRSHHKKESAEYVQNFRNWLSINEGVLRKAQEKKAAKP